MRKNPEFRFEPVTPEHYDLLRSWLAAPHWQEWWGDPELEFSHIRDMVEGHDTTQPFLFVRGDEPVGYIQYWLIGPHQTEDWVRDNPWLMELPQDTVGVDLAVGEVKNLSKDLGSTALRLFAGWLLATGPRNIIIDPDPRNLRAVRAYRKAGFTPVSRLEGRYDDVLIMQYEPNDNGTQP